MVFKDVKENLALLKDILRGVNITVWGGVKSANKFNS
jgi:hypothetical protein